ncbi:methyltransferase domain-containing protein [Sneathiella limimaris]|uniref:methyltransferase domain-containing protein n=1 Tax=Sneathiella limimaris TaxID=1964213 RepID=UPI00146F9380|nr:methyltransferase domain-containing protein [Sneathiella limimaris]
MSTFSVIPEGARLFDRGLVRQRRHRAAQLDWAQNQFLFHEVADRLAERLLDITRTYDIALDLGCHDGIFGQLLKDRNQVDYLVSADLGLDLMRDRASSKVLADEELLPFAPKSFDLIGSVLSLHWVNDLPGALVQIARALKSDGLFLGALFGLETLKELKDSLTEAELEVKGGVSPRISPFTEVRDAGALLQRAGFALPVTDTDVLTLKYRHPFLLMQELRGMGEANSLFERQKGLTGRKVLMRAAEIYQEKYQDEDGLIPATFQIIYLAGWAPHESQQKPLRPGSAKSSLKTVLGGKD